MYDGNEYLQNIFLKISILNHGMFAIKNLQSVIEKKNVEKVLNVLHDDVAFNPCHITLGPQNIHVSFFLFTNYLVRHVITQNN
jgi:hypothetical protein